MMKMVAGELEGLGVPRGRVHTERFSL